MMQECGVASRPPGVSGVLGHDGCGFGPYGKFEGDSSLSKVFAQGSVARQGRSSCFRRSLVAASTLVAYCVSLCAPAIASAREAERAGAAGGPVAPTSVGASLDGSTVANRSDNRVRRADYDLDLRE